MKGIAGLAGNGLLRGTQRKKRRQRGASRVRFLTSVAGHAFRRAPQIRGKFEKRTDNSLKRRNEKSESVKEGA